MSGVTDVLSTPNWGYNDKVVGFAENLNLVMSTEFDDEPTIPFGLCREDNMESAEDAVVGEYLIIKEGDIIDEITITDADIDAFFENMTHDREVATLLQDYVEED